MRLTTHVLSLVAALATTLLALPVAAQTPASIAIRVTDRESGSPLPGAQITVRGELRASADAEGWARLANVPPGMHMVQVRHIGYASEQFLLQLAPGATLREEVVLEPVPVELAPVAVRAERTNRALESAGFYARRRAGLGTFLEREDIERVGHGRSNVSSVLRTVPGVRLLVPPGGRGLVVASSRSVSGGAVGQGRCTSQIIIDGILIQPTQTGARQPSVVVIDDVVNLDEVEAIEWYRGPAQTPPQFNRTGSQESGPACGTLVIWTRAGGSRPGGD